MGAGGEKGLRPKWGRPVRGAHRGEAGNKKGREIFLSGRPTDSQPFLHTFKNTQSQPSFGREKKGGGGSCMSGPRGKRIGKENQGKEHLRRGCGGLRMRFR